jgi:hypothetical protein
MVVVVPLTASYLFGLLSGPTALYKRLSADFKAFDAALPL